MKQTIALIAASTILSMPVAAQGGKKIVANAFTSSSCGGDATQKSIINSGQCYYAKKECGTNPDLKPECQFLKTQTTGDDVSFIATCQGDNIMAKAFIGEGCTDASKAIGQELPIPVDRCINTFKFVCVESTSETTKPEPVNISSASTIQGILGLLALFFV